VLAQKLIINDSNGFVLGGSLSMKQRRPVAVIALIVFELIWATISFGSGIPLILDPSGESIGLPIDLLKNTPISDYMLVGIWFIVGFGLFPLVTAWGLWTKKRFAWADTINRWTHYHWSWSASLLFVIIGEVWIIVQVSLLRYLGLHFLQVLFMVLPLIPLGLVFLPSVRKYFRE